MATSQLSAKDRLVAHKTSLYLAARRNPIPLKELVPSLHQNGVFLSKSDIITTLHNYPENFEIFQENEFYVKLLTKISLCETHCRKDETCNGKSPQCTGLHICKFLIMSGNCNFGHRCNFGHDLTTSHNIEILRENLLDGARVEDLKFILNAARNRSDHTRPRVCKFYNNSAGCKVSREGKPCRNLHFCRHFLQNDCKFGKGCRRSHNIFDPVVKDILEKHGISTKRTAREILTHLRDVIKEEDNDANNTGSDATALGIRKPMKIKGNIPKQQIVRAKVPVSQVDTDDKNEPESICFFYLRGKCLFGNDCHNFHSDYLYQWRYRVEGSLEWILVGRDENRNLELNYSDPEKKECFFMTEDGKICKVDFQTFNIMRVDRKGKNYVIQRLSTMSSVAFERHTFTTDWVWYWLNQHDIWKKYGEAEKGYSADITSKEIEQAYLQNPSGQMTFSTLGHRYILDFSKMVQRNLDYKTERKVCRRPVFVDYSEMKQKKSGKSRQRGAPPVQGAQGGGISEVKAPPFWSRNAMDDLTDHYEIVEIQKNFRSTRKEYEEIEKLFHESLPNTVSIISIQRIENGELYYDYMSKMKRMKKKIDDVGERRLFHGTKGSFVDAICKQGFDFRLNGKSVGTLYGKGSYFATTSKYSHSYTDGTGECAMFIVKVLVGEYTAGKRSYVRPPPKDDSDKCSDLYDSCVNDIHDPSIFVIFDNSGQVYPEYLVKYECRYSC